MKNKGLLALLISLIFASEVSFVLAATLFVDNQDNSCDDEYGTPYCKISKAVFNASAGDIINVAAGTY